MAGEEADTIPAPPPCEAAQFADLRFGHEHETCPPHDVGPDRVIAIGLHAAHHARLIVGCRRHPVEELLHHSDRGSQYTSLAYQAVLAQFQIQVSMSGKGDCYENAMMESFFSSFKTECVQQQAYQSRSEAKLSIFEWIEVFYNRQRRHSSLAYLSPAAFELQGSHV